MTLYKKLNQTMLDRDADAYAELLHDDFTVIFHKSGNSFTPKIELSSSISLTVLFWRLITDFFIYCLLTESFK